MPEWRCLGRFSPRHATAGRHCSRSTCSRRYAWWRCSLPQWSRAAQGHIVNISSVAGLVGTPGLAAYSTAKFGLRGYTEALAEELHPRGVKVTGVYPFFARTPILRSPHYGDGAPPRLPARLVSGPDKVIAATLRGIERDAVHVYPTSVARVIDVLRRVAPGLLGRVVVG